MTYDRFEDLPVWKSAMQLGDRVADLLENRCFRSRRGLKDQLDRAAVSVSNNIAEGFERGTTAGLLTFVYYSKGSAGEVRSMLHGLAKRALKPECLIRDSRFEIQELIALSESVSRQLQGWADYLQNTELNGPRHVNDQVRARDEQTKRRESFLKMLKEMTPRPSPELPPPVRRAFVLGLESRILDFES
jgi:four helix bundle protein